MSVLAQLHSLLQRAQSVLLEPLDTAALAFHGEGLSAAERRLSDLIAAAPAADFPQAWPMLAQALRRTVSARLAGEARLAERWSIVAYALLPLVRADYEAIKRGGT